MLRCRKAFIIFLTVLFFAAYSQLQAAVITVGNQAATQGDTVTVAITVDNPEDAQGVAFTINFDTTNLTLLNISSPFYATFTEQYEGTGANVPTQVVVDSITYYRPMVVTETSDGVILAAVNLQSPSSETTLFNLEFQLSGTIPDGIYPISISSTFLSNTDAGFPEDGMVIPLLFPSRSHTVVQGKISVNTVITDTDNDGIDDNWEIATFGSLTVANATSDFDKDGYSDLQEYLNQQANITDSEGAAFNPRAVNVSYSVGYVSPTISSGFWTMMMPVLMEINQKKK